MEYPELIESEQEWRKKYWAEKSERFWSKVKVVFIVALTIVLIILFTVNVLPIFMSASSIEDTPGYSSDGFYAAIMFLLFIGVLIIGFFWLVANVGAELHKIEKSHGWGYENYLLWYKEEVERIRRYDEEDRREKLEEEERKQKVKDEILDIKSGRVELASKPDVDSEISQPSVGEDKSGGEEDDNTKTESTEELIEIKSDPVQEHQMPIYQGKVVQVENELDSLVTQLGDPLEPRNLLKHYKDKKQVMRAGERVEELSKVFRSINNLLQGRLELEKTRNQIEAEKIRQQYLPKLVNLEELLKLEKIEADIEEQKTRKVEYKATQRTTKATSEKTVKDSKRETKKQKSIKDKRNEHETEVRRQMKEVDKAVENYIRNNPEASESNIEEFRHQFEKKMFRDFGKR